MGRYKIEHVEKLTSEECTYMGDIFSKKGRKRIVADAERIVRSSMEYKDYIYFLRTYVDMTKCALYSNLKNDGRGKMSIQIHHDPLGLADITYILLNKAIMCNEYKSEELLANEVVRLHYRNQVGLIPFSVSVHEMITYDHTSVRLPLQLIYGNYTTFLKEYDEYLTEDLNLEIGDLRSRLQDRYTYSKESIADLCADMEPTYVILKVDGQEVPVPVVVNDESEKAVI